MTTRATLRAALRQDLRDEDSANYIWTDAILNRHFAHALEEIAQRCPLVASLTVAIANPSVRRISLSGQAALTASTFLRISALECPADEYPQKWIPFREESGPSVYVLAPDLPAAAATLRVWYAKRFTVDDSSGDMPVTLDQVAILGATHFALADQAVDTSDKLTPTDTPRFYARLKADTASRWRDELRRISHLNPEPIWTPAWTTQPDGSDY